MPRCVDCGLEADRAEMFGLPDELRCASCASKGRVSLAALPKRRIADNVPAWTICLITMAVIVFFAERTPGGRRISFLWNDPTRIWDGELWRLITTVLPHGGYLHLIFNCYALALLGIATETAIGSMRFLGMALLMATASSASEFLIHPTPVVGLSGVVYGLFGYLFALRLYKDYARIAMNESVMKQFIGWYVLCWVLTYAADWRIANFAHTGGFVVGWLTGKATLKQKTELRIAGVAAGVVFLACLTMYMPWNEGYRLYHQEKETMQKLRDGTPVILNADDGE